MKSYKQALDVQPLLSRSVQPSEDIIDEGTNELGLLCCQKETII